MAHMLLDGTGDHASTPDAAALDVTGDIDMRARVAVDLWSGGGSLQSFISKDRGTGSDRSYSFFLTSSGTLRLTHFADGSTPITTLSTVAVGFSDGEIGWVRVTLDVDNGASGYDVKFWTASGALTNPDAADFSQLGSTVTGGATTSIFASTEQLTAGTNSNGTSNPLAGKYYRAQILSGIDGTLAFDADPSDPATWKTATTFEEKANDATVTLQGDAELVGGGPSRDLMLMGMG